MINFAEEAAQSGIPLTALDVKISSIIQHPGFPHGRVDAAIQSEEPDVDIGRRRTKNLEPDHGWSEPGRSKRNSGFEDRKVTLSSKTQDPTRLAEGISFFPVTVRVPRKTKTVRVVLETEDGGRIGASEVDRQAIDAAPAKPTPEPQPQPTAP